MQEREFYRGNKLRTHVDAMSKNDLKFELENMRDNFDVLMIKTELHRMIDKVEDIQTLRDMANCFDDAYNKMMQEDCYRMLYGTRDNICAMAESLADNYKAHELVYFNRLMANLYFANEQKAI